MLFKYSYKIEIVVNAIHVLVTSIILNLGRTFYQSQLFARSPTVFTRVTFYGLIAKCGESFWRKLQKSGCAYAPVQVIEIRIVSTIFRSVSHLKMTKKF